MKESLKRQDYGKAFRRWQDIVGAAAVSVALVLFFAWFFYRSFWAVIPLVPLGIYCFLHIGKRQSARRVRELTVQFRECILSVAGSLRAGYALENAFVESREDIRLLYGESSMMYHELELIRRGMILNITLEELLGDLAARSDCEAIRQFAAVVAIAKRGGGNVAQTIRSTAELIGRKIETTQEMLTLLRGRQMEQRIMEVMPFGIVLYIGSTYPGYFTSLYHNPTGILVMTVCLGIYLGACIWGERILERIADSL